MSSTCRLEYNGTAYEFPEIVGTENEPAVDISELRNKTGLITLDDGYGNTGACQSRITFIDGEKGILRYRGYPIQALAEKSTFIETAYLLIWGELPTHEQLDSFSRLLTEYELMHESLRNHFEGFPAHAPPMAMLSAMINAMSCYEPEFANLTDPKHFEQAAARLMSKVRTIAAAAYKMSVGQPMMYPKPEFRYVENFLHMMFSMPYREIVPDPDAVRALNLFLILHGDHEQNCSTSTVRMVASSQANLFASCAAGVCALWGPLHGGANVAVIEMLQEIQKSGINLKEFVNRVKNKDSRARLMGFGHRVYKNFDPRSLILKEAADKVLKKLHREDPMLELATQLEEVALQDSYFIERKLYPNVDFYSGIILRALGIPLSMYTVMFAIGRLPGWIANYREVATSPKARIARPRQVYTGPTIREYVPINQRTEKHAV